MLILIDSSCAASRGLLLARARGFLVLDAQVRDRDETETRR